MSAWLAASRRELDLSLASTGDGRYELREVLLREVDHTSAFRGKIKRHESLDHGDTVIESLIRHSPCPESLDHVAVDVGVAVDPGLVL